MRNTIGVACLFLYGALALGAQDSNHKGGLTGHTSADYKKCEKCAPALGKALEFVKKNYRQSRLPGHIYAGFLFMMEGSGQYNGDLEYILNYACRSIKQERFGANWHMAMSSMMLERTFECPPISS